MNDFLLGVFTGNHAGAEAPFEAGEYTIGSAPECDVTLTDSTLALRHFSFLLAEDGSVRLAPLEGPLILNGKQVSDPLDWPARAPILAGMVCLAWTQRGQGWTGMTLPSLLATEEQPAESKTESQNPKARTEETKKEITNKASVRPETSRRFGQLAIFGVIILILIGLTIELSLSDNKSEARLNKLKQVLRTEGFSDLWVSEKAGRIIIHGLTPTEVDANKVRDIAARQSYPVQVIVRDQEEFSRAILSVLAEYSIFPQVRFEDGEAVLSGYALDSLTENAALSWARSAVPRIATIRSVLLTRKAVEATLAAELRKAGLTEKIAVDWRPGVIALSGKADKNTLAEIMEAVRGALDSPIAFQLAISSEEKRIYAGNITSNRLNALPTQKHAPVQESQGGPFNARLSLRSVTPSSGDAGLPFITTSDGAVYFPGGTLPSGYTLTGIYADRLEFSKNGSSMAYKLRGH